MRCWWERFAIACRERYEGSVVQELLRALNAVDFGNRIILFGAALLLSTLPLIVLLSAFANNRVDDDIAQHLGLNLQGARIVGGLFKTSIPAFNFAILLSLLLSLAGTVAVARSIQTAYERAFDNSPSQGIWNLLRCVVWVVAAAGFFIADAAVSSALRPAGTLVLGLVDFVGLALFFWWSLYFLLAGRQSWRRLSLLAITTALFWIGLGVFASIYFSSTIVSDSRLYGTIGVVFSLMTWFIAIGAVIILGAVVGVVWEKRRDVRRRGSGPPGVQDNTECPGNT